MMPGKEHAGRRLILACRDMAKADTLCAELADTCPRADVRTAPLDLADEESVRGLAAMVTRPGTPLLMINNAGIMRRRYGADAMGRELTLAVNYFNTRLLTELLLASGCLRRVVFTTSLTRFFYRPEKKAAEVTADTFHQLRTYGLSKRLITDYAAALNASRLTEVACADPGIVDSGMISMQRWYDPLADIVFRPFIRTPRHGSDPAWRAMHMAPGYIYCRHRRRKLPDLPVHIYH